MIFDTAEIQKHYLDAVRLQGSPRGQPVLACVMAKDPAAVSFVNALKAKGKSVGVDVLDWYSPEERFWETQVRILNSDRSIHGILQVSPPASLQNYHSLINDEKNVEGNDYDDRVARISCTAQAIVRMAAEMIRQECEMDRPSHEIWMRELLHEQNVVIIGYGKAVGKPLSYLLMRHHIGSVTTIHKYTDPWTANRVIREADIIVSATGNPDVFPQLVSPGELRGKYIIDAGISERDGKVVGDIDTEKFAEHNMVTPVPGGVGAVTTAMILYNVARAAAGDL